jgi:hypothetical protein
MLQEKWKEYGESLKGIDHYHSDDIGIGGKNVS